MSISPINLQVLLHYLYMNEDYPIRKDLMEWTPAVKDSIRKFIRQGLLKETKSIKPELLPLYEMTDKGKVYINAIMEAVDTVPLPIQGWVIP